jgi:peptidoglycan hydrolase-like protein with peptidoglycan-binding domain
VQKISRKAAAWISGAVLAVGGVTAGIVAATAGGSGAENHPAAAVQTPHPAAVKPASLTLLSVSPADGARDVNGANFITVTYNEPLPATAPMPVLKPAIAGSWQRSGDSVWFVPATGYPAHTKVTVTWAGTGETTDRSGYSSSFTTGTFSTLRLQEILGQLGYLPLTWTPAAGEAVVPGSAVAQLSAAFDPPAGTFTWEPGYPSKLHSFWQQGSPNTVDAGAITGFEADHGMTTDGVAGAAVWTALLKAAAADQRNTHGYSYAYVSEHIPETLTIWHDGKQVFNSPTNTGISIDPTPIGTFPVYLKLPYQVMQGTNPDGSHYADPVQWVSYFSGGSAVHYISRGSYGWPQSLGCVELPYSAAEQAYPYLPYGTLVTVS